MFREQVNVNADKQSTSPSLKSNPAFSSLVVKKQKFIMNGLLNTYSSAASK